MGCCSSSPVAPAYKDPKQSIRDEITWYINNSKFFVLPTCAPFNIVGLCL